MSTITTSAAVVEQNVGSTDGAAVVTGLLAPGAWAAQGSCRRSDPDDLFVQGAAQNRAKTVCLGCPVRTECLADALDNRTEFGVWGGMTERERRALLRRRPNVRSWRRLLEAAKAEHERQVAGSEAVEAVVAALPRQRTA